MVKAVEFVRVYVHPSCSDHLVLPLEFVNMLEKPLPHEATLHDQTGRSWIVTITTGDERTVSGLCMKDGWRDFAGHHALAYGDFLLFGYDGESDFSVSVFASDGFKKHSGIPTDCFSHPVKEEPDVEPENVPDTSKPDLGGRNSFGTPVIGTSQAQTGEMTPVPVIKCEEFELGEADYILLKPETCGFTGTHGDTGGISKAFLKAHGIQLEPKIELCDQEGEKWPVKVYSAGRHTSFTSGWSEFRKSHKLGTSNSCLFEFVLGVGNKCKAVHVQISGGRSRSHVKCSDA
ncbi:PREDICTED: putative B3 domain-containing protein At5g66980 [Tarenaya hassleriana]|uniref:putative B3 domain-containing protein At5g66980 n=1 Tax=Tarenaya hassleriana TaxID=28532 RepID=UPI00053C7DEB|nr:PREDICTED: putative B3 domain-containing protein At5g66980 [Tarenaya hassleriana]